MSTIMSHEEMLHSILKELREIKKFMELTYNLFSKYDSQAILELEELRSADIKKK